MDAKRSLQFSALCMLVMAVATVAGFVVQQRRIEALERQVGMLEQSNVNHGARLDARRPTGEWREPLVTPPPAPKPPVVRLPSEYGLRQYPPPAGKP